MGFVVVLHHLIFWFCSQCTHQNESSMTRSGTVSLVSRCGPKASTALDNKASQIKMGSWARLPGFDFWNWYSLDQCLGFSFCNVGPMTAPISLGGLNDSTCKAFQKSAGTQETLYKGLFCRDTDIERFRCNSRCSINIWWINNVLSLRKGQSPN